MNKFQKIGLFLLGSAVGSGVTFLVLNQKYSKIMEEEIEEYRKEAMEAIKYYKNVADGTYIDLDDAGDLNINPLGEEDEESLYPSLDEVKKNIDYHEISKQYLTDVDKGDINEVVKARRYKRSQLSQEDIVDDYPTEDDSEEDDENDIPTPITVGMVSGNSDLIFVISEEGFMETETHFDKENLFYYELDDVLTDDRDEMITDKVGIVGNALDNFGGVSGNPDIVYVRNNNISTDFEIEKINDSYTSVVLGIEIGE